jgi:hypothetical protein
MEAVSCIAFNATYNVRIQNSNTSSTIAVLDTPQLHNKLSRRLGPNFGQSLSLDALASGLAYAVNKAVIYSYNTYNFTASTSLAADSALLDGFGSDWPTHPMRDLPLLMQNISLSLLSGFLSWDNYTTLLPFQTICNYAASQWSYDPRQLFATYGVGIGTTTICVISGFCAVHANNAEESLGFSRLLEVILNGSLPLERGTILSESSKALIQVREGSFKCVPECVSIQHILHPSE